MPRGVNLVQNVGGRSVQGVWGTNSPETEAILDFYMHNFDLILNYFCFARATEIRHFIYTVVQKKRANFGRL